MALPTEGDKNWPLTQDLLSHVQSLNPQNTPTYYLTVAVTYITRPLGNISTALLFTQSIESYMAGMRALDNQNGVFYIAMTPEETRDKEDTDQVREYGMTYMAIIMGSKVFPPIRVGYSSYASHKGSVSSSDLTDKQQALNPKVFF